MGDINSISKNGVITRTICEVHREIYREIHKLHFEGKLDESECELIVEKLQEAFNYAKKMNNKLRQYKHNYDVGWWEEQKLDGGELREVEKIQKEIKKRSDNK